MKRNSPDRTRSYIARPFDRIKRNVLLRRLLSRIMKNWTFEMKGGLAKGMKRRFGIGFTPRYSITEEERFLMGLPYEGKTVYDIGGFVGMYTLFFARAVGPKGKVVTFEPNPTNYEDIVYNVKLNEFDNVTILNVALGDKRARTFMVVTPMYPARGSLEQTRSNKRLEQGVGVSIDVELYPLDRLAKEERLPIPHMIKMDVEGLEIEVLKGMREIIERHRPALFVELHRKIPKQTFRRLIDWGYSFYHVEKKIWITVKNLNRVSDGHIYCTYDERDVS